MIISASRRTDIPSYYSEWLYNRIREGYVYVRNPMNTHQISNISLLPDVVDGIVFWTKNPTPMIDRLGELDKYVYYFQFTLNAYGKDVEPYIPSKKQIIIPTFQELSKMIGKEKVVWRYDPIFINAKYTIEYHVKYFKMLAERLSGYTEKCTISFIDLYKKTQRNTVPLHIQSPTDEQIKALMSEFREIASKNSFLLDTCSEKIDLKQYGITHAHCIERERLEKLGKYTLKIEKDKNQRQECGCVESIDIGSYNTCRNGCLYCYANFSQKTVYENCRLHDSTSPLLFGTVGSDDIIKHRNVHSCRDCQMKLF